ncbi:unnamed protein product [Cuscuta epithymum]|uniref:Pectate lyase n=1 Tax=Cuscuta epithymum TaxID=186058 RepID=A0AAV0FPP8_9ASTE|nr:unnamed protein product [Cuscuta epithymum]
MVTDASDDYDPKNPPQGTLRHGVLTEGPVWIIFQGDMVINLKHELFVSGDTTIDGRGAKVQITGAGCITLLSVTNVIIHNLLIYNCRPSPANDVVELNQGLTEPVSPSDGDAISVQKSRDVWIDHCILANCADGLIDVTQGSTAVTVSNNRFTHHDKVMLLGHEDDDKDDAGMQVTVAFNVFGELLGQRMPRCRTGYFHVVNNDYTGWIIYAVGGSGSPTINCQGNRFKAPDNPHAKEITKRIDAAKDWKSWNWRSTDDVLLNGAFFVHSGEQDSDDPYKQATSSVGVKSGSQVEQLTGNVGVLGLTGGGSGVVDNIPGIIQFNPNTIVYEGGGPTPDGGGGLTQSDQDNNSSPKTIFAVIGVLLLFALVGCGVYYAKRKKDDEK